jgi:aspartate/methionine/tyrosine aminotransferase
MEFEKYPFEKLRELLEGVQPNRDLEVIDLTIGEPQIETPDFIQNSLKESSDLLKKYPKSGGEEYLKESMIGFMKRRFEVELSKEELIPTFGTREVLFNFPQYLLSEVEKPKIVFTNPFYQIYEGSAIASRAEVEYINLIPENGFQPEIEEEKLEDADLVILNFPNNPTSSNLNFEGFKKWIELSRRYNFVLLNDECYSEIYTKKPPLSLLEVAIKLGESFENLLVVNSISKRSSAPGLRSGFIAGDRDILKGYMRYRTYLGTAIPLPLQIASAQAWGDEVHAKENRKKYVENFEVANRILDIPIPEATFYIWLPVKNDLEFTKTLWIESSIKVIPGRFLGRDGVGRNFVRIALVESVDRVEIALSRISKYL